MRTHPLPLVLGLVLAVWAPAAEAQRYHVHTYGENEGLPSSTINDVVQDPSGRMWFATRAGIAVYDGVEWTTSSPLDPSSPGQHGLAFDERGTLWAVAKRMPGLVSYLQDGRWQAFSQPPYGEGIWDRTSAFAVTLREDRPLIAVGTEKGNLFIWDHDRWHRFTRREGLAVDSVPGVVGWEGRFFVATHEGLAIYADGRFHTERDPQMPSSAVLGLALEETAQGPPRLWMVGRNWLGVRQGDGFTLLADALPFRFEKGYRHLVLEPDRRGGIFFGNPVGLGRFDPRQGLEELGPRSGLIAKGTTVLYLDREENLWVGCLRGLSKIVSFRFATYDQEHGLLESEVTAVLERRQGGYVLGHDSGLTFLDADAEGPRTLSLVAGREPLADSPRVLDLAEDASGHLWVAASNLGLARIDGDRVRWYLTEFPRVVSVVVDSAQTLWAATADRLYRWQDDRFVAEEGTPAAVFRRLFRRPAGGLYLATAQDGVYVLEDGEWSHLASSERGGNNVFAVVEDSAGTLWVGTEAGLFRRRGPGLERAGEEEPAVFRPVFFLVEDGYRQLWIGTDNGVLRWDGKRLRHFTALDGLGGRETNRAAGIVDSRGQVWIGTDRGVSVYRKAGERREPSPPRVELLALEAVGERFSLAGPIPLEHHQNELIFHFRALSFIDEKRLRFRSRLEGFEADWLAPYSSPRQELRYTNLAPGRYRFHLRAANADGVWSEAVSSAEIVIARPFWRWPSFYAALAAVFAGCLVAAQRYLAQQRYARRLESEVRDRTAQLRQSEQAIEAEKTRLEATLNSIGDGVITAAMDGTVLLLNPAAEKLTGWTGAEAEGKKLSAILDLSRQAGSAPRKSFDPVAWVTTADRAVALADDVVLRDRQATLRHLEISGAPIRQQSGREWFWPSVTSPPAGGSRRN